MPDKLKEFNELFINTKTGDVKNEHLFQGRILGLTSYFRSAQEQLMPAYDIEEDLVIENIPMSDYQFGIYEKAREGERDIEKDNARKGKTSGGVYEDSTSTYRIFSRAFCNYVFPPQIGRPFPKKEHDLNTAVKAPNIEEDNLDIVTVDEQLANPDGRFDQSDADALKALARETKDASYEVRIREALRALKVGGADYLSPEGLQIYSPKFLAILENVSEKAGFAFDLFPI